MYIYIYIPSALISESVRFRLWWFLNTWYLLKEVNQAKYINYLCVMQCYGALCALYQLGISPPIPVGKAFAQQVVWLWPGGQVVGWLVLILGNVIGPGHERLFSMWWDVGIAGLIFISACFSCWRLMFPCGEMRDQVGQRGFF